MEKKEYSAPELTVVEMGHQASLLDGSMYCDEGPGCPMGLAPTSNDHLA